jgi:hypothetical protein
MQGQAAEAVLKKIILATLRYFFQKPCIREHFAAIAL